jgi:hypothetical protein
MNTLPERPAVSPAWRSRLERLFQGTKSAPPRDLAALVREELRVDLAARYGGLTIAHPFGKGSGQLSMKVQQVESDVAAGLAFIVLKTVVAEDAAGERSMEEWADPQRRMTVEPIVSARGQKSWTVTWAGRGWAGSLDEYLDFFAQALEIAKAPDVPVIPSVKYHLPKHDDRPFREVEYQHTTRRLIDVWDRVGCGGPLLLEKDLSPTLAGDARSAKQASILGWLRRVPALIDNSAPGRVRVGVKVMNALFDDAFQLEMVRTLAAAEPPPDFLVVFNRLYDAARGGAYGGYDLSDRNLRVLDALREHLPSSGPPVLPSLSATGNICSGRMMVEYARRGCENGQLHTFFQLPQSEYTATGGSRTARGLHTLLLHPDLGLAAWLRHLHEAGELEACDGVFRFLDVADGVQDRA